MSYEERLEVALSNAAQREKENMHIVENHDNLKRIYKELLASEESKSKKNEPETRPNEGSHTDESGEVQSRKVKKTPLCRHKEKCKFLPNCRFGHPELEGSVEASDEKESGEWQTRKVKKRPLCRYKEKCQFLPNCRFSHPESERFLGITEGE